MKEKKVAIVTGGSKGIGAEIVRHLLAHDMRVVVADIKAAAGDEDPARLLVVKTDVKQEASVKQMIRQTLAHFGRIDCLVNNAGLLPKERGSFEKTSIKIWNDFIATNLTGAFLTAKYAAAFLKKQKGSIINIASTRALQSEGNCEPYAASKGGLVSLTHELAISLGPDIRVNCISPGWIHTGTEKFKKSVHEQHPVGRIGKPEDVAHLVTFLMSEEASFITGQNFIVDGGMTVKMIYSS